MRRELPMILIRVIVGLVYLLEGLLTFLRPALFGASHYSTLGIPFAAQIAPLVGGLEIVAGAAILLSFYAGDAALLLLIVILGDIVTSKLPLLLGHALGPFALDTQAPLGTGAVSFLHAIRSDMCFLFCLIAILIDSGLRIGRRRHWYQGD